MSSSPHLVGLTGRAHEVVSKISCEVTGKIPGWLQGSLYRNGPGLFDVHTSKGKTATVPHWFDGLTLLHKFTFEPGSGVSYCNRYLYPKLEKYMRENGRLPGSFAGDPCQSLFGVAMSRLSGGLRWLAGHRAPNEVNVGVTIGHIQGDRLVSKTDFNGLVELDHETMEPQPWFRYTDINPAFSGFLSAAHGQYDPSTKQYYNYTLDFPRGAATYNIFCLPDQGNPAGYLLAKLRADAAYIHSFAMTEHYLVFMVWPAVLSLLQLALRGSPAPALNWQPEKGTMLYVIDRKQDGPGHVATYKAPAFFCFHTINSFEEGSTLHVDLCGYDDMQLIQDLYMKALRSGRPVEAQGTIRRYTLPGLAAAIASGPSVVQRAEVAVLCDGRGRGGELFDLPRINRALAMKPYSFVYCAAKAAPDSCFFDALAKVDVRSGALMSWRREGHFPGEPIFVARPGAVEEDDGVLLSVVLEGPAQRSFLLVLDARTMEEVGRASVPQPVPFGFHGQYLAADGTGTQLD